MSPRRTICPRISITSSTEGDACGHSRLDSSAGLARVWLVAAALAVAAQASAQLPAAQPVGAAGQPRLAVGYGTLPLSFEANQGQSEERVKFLARGRGYSLFLTPTEVVLSLRAPAQHTPAAAEHAGTGTRAEPEGPAQPAAVVRMRLVGANTHPQLTGLDPLPGTSNYFIGNDPARWQRDVPNYARVKYAGVYPGVDLVYYGNQRQLEYDIVVAPGADPGRIALAFEGVQKLSLDSEGNLVLQTSQGDIAQHKPVIYQDIGGTRQRVDGRYVLRAKHRVGFHVASYDTTQPLVIDPVLSYSTYLGGNGYDVGYAIAVDSAGSAYVTGVTTSANFPGASGSPIQPTWLGSNDVFVTKLNAAGNALVYSTYLGGSGGEIGYAIAVDSLGNAYVTGETDSPTLAGPSNIPFPRVGAFQSSYAGGGDAFVTKINTLGDALVYSTYFGGSGTERGYGIAVDGSFNAYVTGHTSSSQGGVPSPSDFPTAFPFQAQNASVGSFDAFVTKFNAAGSALVYSTFLGGNHSEYSLDGGAITVDSDGNAYVGGTTWSPNFPGASTSTIQPTFGGVVTGRSDGFVVKFNAAGSALLYSTYLGGTTDDAVNGIAIDTARNAYVVGYTDSVDFPTASPMQASRGGPGEDAFVAEINAAGSALVYSTYLGGSNGERAFAVAVDVGGAAYIAGWTTSSNFPTVAPVQATLGGSGDAFISKLNAAGSALVYSTYLGGSSGVEQAYGIALDSAGNAYVTGETNSANFPIAAPGVSGLASGVTAVSAGWSHTCAVTGGGGVRCWGDNGYGQLGDGTTTERHTPVPVSGLASGVTAITAGNYGHTCAVTSGGGVSCWGFNAFGQLGDGTTTDRHTPVAVSGLSSGVTAVADHGPHTCALTSGGGVSCWGWNTNGELGDGTTTDRHTPVAVSGLSSGVTAVAAGFSHTCAVTSGGGVWCWGYNTYGRLGDGTTTERHTPVAVSGLTSGVTAIAAGYADTCALTGGGGVWCWGSNALGQVGDGTTTERHTPVAVTGLASGVIAIAAGTDHTCALTSGGGVLCWGDNAYGNLGDGTTTNRSTPGPVSGLSSGVTAIAAGNLHTCAVTSGGGVSCWGSNAFGQLGDGTTTERHSPGPFQATLGGSMDAFVAKIVSVAAVSGTFTDFNGDGKPDLLWRSGETGQNVVWFMDGATVVGQALLPIVADTNWQIVATADLNADGKPDLVWRNVTTGQNVVWYMNGTTFVSQALLPTVADTSWQIVAAADFNADGKPDLVWRNTATGQNAVWYMNGATFVSQASLPTVADTSWHIGLVTDFNGDGQADIVWRNGVTGQNVVWYLNGVTFVSQALLPTVSDVHWDLAGARTPPAAVGDFNGDGQPDLLWRNVSTGQNVVWYMSGATFLSQAMLPTVADTNWQIVATADMNGDGQADIVWRNILTGLNVVWFMSGATFVSQASLPTVADPTWQIVAAADLNGDGQPDLVWRNVATGQNVVWYLNGITFLSQASLPSVADATWRIVTAADFNADGQTDLVWRNVSTGQNVVWYMSGATFLSQAVLPSVADTAWQIALAGDFNADGKPDLVWRNVTTGQNAVWYLDGVTFLGQALLPSVADPNWMILRDKR